MKIIIILVSLIAACPAVAQNVSVPRVTAIGVARVFVSPDTETWSLTIAAVRPTSADATGRVSSVIDSLTDFLGRAGIPRDKMQVSSVAFWANTNREGKHGRRDGYKASADMTFELTDLERHEEIVSELAAFEEVTVDDTEWSYSKQIEVMEMTRDDALRAARKKAERMAYVLGMKIGKPILIADEGASVGTRSSGAGSYVNESSVYRSRDDDEEFDANQGLIPIRARVVVHFELVGVRSAEPGATGNPGDAQ